MGHPRSAMGCSACDGARGVRGVRQGDARRPPPVRVPRRQRRRRLEEDSAPRHRVERLRPAPGHARPRRRGQAGRRARAPDGVLSPVARPEAFRRQAEPGPARAPRGRGRSAEAITETLVRFVNLCLDEEAGGIFYSIQAASRRFHTEEEYARFGEPYDRRILDVAMARSKLVIVHCHGDELMFERLARLPGHAWNWDDRAAGPSLRDGKAKVNGAVIGGVNQWATVCEGTGEEVRAEVNDAVTQTDGIGLIVGPGWGRPPPGPEPRAQPSGRSGSWPEIPT